MMARLPSGRSKIFIKGNIVLLLAALPLAVAFFAARHWSEGQAKRISDDLQRKCEASKSGGDVDRLVGGGLYEMETDDPHFLERQGILAEAGMILPTGAAGGEVKYFSAAFRGVPYLSSGVQVIVITGEKGLVLACKAFPVINNGERLSPRR